MSQIYLKLCFIITQDSIFKLHSAIFIEKYFSLKPLAKIKTFLSFNEEKLTYNN